jgi:hypothetical protein
MKDYCIQLGLTHEDIASLLNGEISTFNFVPTEDTDYDDRISISIKEMEEDTTLSECMNLSVDNISAIS